MVKIFCFGNYGSKDFPFENTDLSIFVRRALQDKFHILLTDNRFSSPPTCLYRRKLLDKSPTLVAQRRFPPAQRWCTFTNLIFIFCRKDDILFVNDVYWGVSVKSMTVQSILIFQNRKSLIQLPIKQLLSYNFHLFITPCSTAEAMLISDGLLDVLWSPMNCHRTSNRDSLTVLTAKNWIKPATTAWAMWMTFSNESHFNLHFWKWENDLRLRSYIFLKWK